MGQSAQASLDNTNAKIKEILTVLNEAIEGSHSLTDIGGIILILLPGSNKGKEFFQN